MSESSSVGITGSHSRSCSIPPASTPLPAGISGTYDPVPTCPRVSARCAAGGSASAPGWCRSGASAIALGRMPRMFPAVLLRQLVVLELLAEVLARCREPVQAQLAEGRPQVAADDQLMPPSARLCDRRVRGCSGGTAWRSPRGSLVGRQGRSAIAAAVSRSRYAVSRRMWFMTVTSHP